MSIKNSTIVVASFILIGRIAGFIREWLLSSISGANAETDVAVVLFTFPDLIVSLLLGGGLSSSLIPYLGSLEKQKKKKFVRQLSIYIGLIFFIISLLISIKLDILWNLLAPGIGQEVKRGANNYFLIILFCLPLTSITGVLTAYLNSKSKFKIAASGNVLFNIGIIIGLLINIPIFLRVTVGIIIGSLLRFFVQSNYANLLKNIWRESLFDENLITKEFIKLFVFNFTFVTSIILVPTIGRAWASTINEGSLTIFSYSNKLIELPVGIIIASLGSVLLTKLSNDSSILNIIKSIRFVFLVTIIFSIPAFFAAPLIVKVVYFKGQFDTYQLNELIAITKIGYLFLVPKVLISLFSTIFAARKKQKILLPVGILMVILTNFFSYIFSFNGKLESIAYANGITYLFISILLYILLNKHISKKINKELITF